MSQESDNKDNSNSQANSTQKPVRPKVNPDKTINYRQDGADKHHRKK